MAPCWKTASPRNPNVINEWYLSFIFHIPVERGENNDSVCNAILDYRLQIPVQFLGYENAACFRRRTVADKRIDIFDSDLDGGPSDRSFFLEKARQFEGLSLFPIIYKGYTEFSPDYFVVEADVCGKQGWKQLQTRPDSLQFPFVCEYGKMR
jgi:hypothetical protein